MHVFGVGPRPPYTTFLALFHGHIRPRPRPWSWPWHPGPSPCPGPPGPGHGGPGLPRLTSGRASDGACICKPIFCIVDYSDPIFFDGTPIFFTADLFFLQNTYVFSKIHVFSPKHIFFGDSTYFFYRIPSFFSIDLQVMRYDTYSLACMVTEVQVGGPSGRLRVGSWLAVQGAEVCPSGVNGLGAPGLGRPMLGWGRGLAAL